MNFQGQNEFVGAIIPSHANPLTYLVLEHKEYTHKQWGFPGGKPIEGEILVEALKREVGEEINIEVIDPMFVGKWSVNVHGTLWLGHYYLINSYRGIPAVQETKKHGRISYLNLHELIIGNCDPEFRAVAHLELKSFTGA